MIGECEVPRGRQLINRQPITRWNRAQLRSRPGAALSVCLLLLTTLAVGCAERETVALADGTDFSFDGQGRWLVVNYWAEWCGPCRHEIPELNELHASEERDVVVLGVNYDGLVGDKLAAVIGRMDIEFPVLVADPRERWGQPLPTVLPSTYLIAPDGELFDVLLGPQSMASIVGRMDERAVAAE